MQIQGTGSASILLSSVFSLPSVDAYEIVLGAQGNSVTQLLRGRTRDTPLLEVPSDDILSSTDLAYYWISWKNAYIQVVIERMQVCFY